MQAAFLDEAVKYNVLPLDDRFRSGSALHWPGVRTSWEVARHSRSIRA